MTNTPPTERPASYRMPGKHGPAASIHIRRPAFSEIPLICKSLAQTFKNDSMFGDFIHPHRDKYPDDVERYWLKRFRRQYYKPTEVFLVTSEPGSGPSQDETITGFAHWSRSGPEDELKKFGWSTHGWWDPSRLLQVLASCYAAITSYVYPNRAASPENEDAIERSETFITHYWSGSRSSNWDLHLLGVHPDHQSKGLGRALVAWGMTKAQEERVSCSVIAAADKDIFYQKCGFLVCVGHAGEGEGNPAAGVAGGNIWFRDYQDES